MIVETVGVGGGTERRRAAASASDRSGKKVKEGKDETNRSSA